MHAVYSVTPRKKTSNQRPTREVNEGNSGFHNNEPMKETILIHQFTESTLRKPGELSNVRIGNRIYEHAHSLHRREAENIRDIGNNGKGTNIKMIRLIRESPDDSAKIPSGEQTQQLDAESTSAHGQGLVNPLVIGIAVVCGILFVALVVVAVVLRRKLLSQPPRTVEMNTQEVAVAQSEGTRV